MEKNWNKYRLIILCVIILSFFVSRVFLKEDESPELPSIPHTLNRSTDNIVLTRHAKCRMECRDITEDEIKEILHNGTINYLKSDLKNERGAMYAVDGYSHEHQHIRVVYSPKNTETIIITCIDIDKESECNCN